MNGGDSLIEDVPVDLETVRGMMHSLQRRFAALPNVVHLPSSHLIVVGDLHGELGPASNAVELLETHPEATLVFLGDYVDRGEQQVETVNLVMAAAAKHGDRVVMLRGNHESFGVATRYGFFEACQQSYGTDAFDEYMAFFATLPLAAVSPDGVFLCHGGVPAGLTSLGQLDLEDRFSRDFVSTLAMQQVWNDPRDGEFDFLPSDRGEGILYFGRHAFRRFMDVTDTEMLVRAHEVVPEGIRTMFDGRLISVFSASYRGTVTPKALVLESDARWHAVPL
ncbi:MAG: metallophosphoesterase [Candidatus Thorarchaeota archaeon]|nr:metallophosphoesterase [Candidatus Thorarchaeota archaeon]